MVWGSGIDQSRSICGKRKRSIGFETRDQSLCDRFPRFTIRLDRGFVQGDGLVQPAEIVDGIPPWSPACRRNFCGFHYDRLLIIAVGLDRPDGKASLVIAADKRQQAVSG